MSQSLAVAHPLSYVYFSLATAALLILYSIISCCYSSWIFECCVCAPGCSVVITHIRSYCVSVLTVNLHTCQNLENINSKMLYIVYAGC